MAHEAELYEPGGLGHTGEAGAGGGGGETGGGGGETGGGGGETGGGGGGGGDGGGEVVNPGGGDGGGGGGDPLNPGGGFGSNKSSGSVSDSSGSSGPSGSSGSSGSTSGSASGSASGSGNNCCDPDYVIVTWSWIDPRTNQTVVRNDYVPGGCGHYRAEGPPIDDYLSGTGVGFGYYYGYGDDPVWFIDLQYTSSIGWELDIGSYYLARFGYHQGPGDVCAPGGTYLYIAGYSSGIVTVGP